MWAIPGLVCRVLLHHTGRHDPVRSQWMGSWAWAVLTALNLAVDMVNFTVAPATTCPWVLQVKYMVPFVFLLVVLNTGTHGLSFASKFALMTILLADCIVGMSSCHDPELDPWFICAMGAIVLGSATTHTAELYLRRIYAEKVQEQQSRTEEKRQLEERNEQLQAEKERLLYDVQRRGRPLDDDDDRSAIRRGLLAGPSQPCPPTSDTDPSEPRGALSSVSPPTLPPGPPSSASSGSVLAAEVLVGMAMPTDAGAAQQSIRMQAQVDRFTDNEQLQVTDSRDTSEATSLFSSLPPSLPPGLPPARPAGPARCASQAPIGRPSPGSGTRSTQVGDAAPWHSRHLPFRQRPRRAPRRVRSKLRQRH